MRSGTVVDGEAALAYLVEKWKWIEKNWRSPTQFNRTKFPR